MGIKKIIYISLLNNQEVHLYREELRVGIDIYSKREEWKPISEFRIHVLDYAKSADKEWWAYGLVYNDYFEEYRQGVIDVFSCWQNQKNFEWFKLPKNSSMKADYLYACFLYSGISSEILKKDIYEIDLSLVNEEKDFYYLFRLSFIGERGYFGYDLHTFSDCILEIYKKESSYISNVKVVFLNANKIQENNIILLYEEVKSILVRFKFNIEAKRDK